LHNESPDNNGDKNSRISQLQAQGNLDALERRDHLSDENESSQSVVFNPDGASSNPDRNQYDQVLRLMNQNQPA
jgi:hypothetical protein